MGRLCGPPLLSEPHLMSICMYMLTKCVCTVHVRTLLSSCEALMRVSSKLGASISSTPSSRRLSMGKNTLEKMRGREGREKGGREEALVTAPWPYTLPHTPPLFHTSPPPSHIPHTPPPSTHTPPPNVHYHPPTYPHPP